MSNATNYVKESKFEKLLSMISSSIKELRDHYEMTIISYNKTIEEQTDLKNALGKVSEDLKDKTSESELIRLELENKKREFSIKSDELYEKIDFLRDKSEILQSRYELLCSATSPKKDNSDRYEQFKKIINEQLFPLINRINAISNEAEQVIKIHSIDDEFRLIESMDAFSERSIVAVAGGFSSGKSSFISSLFESESVFLPIGIEPVTAIPTYVTHSDDLKIKGYPSSGGQFDIPQQIYAKLSHQFVEDFGFNLRDLLPFASLEVPMKSYKNLAFIDLPGYNPGDRDGSTADDRSMSVEYISQAQALIWVIGLDSNGTIPRDDLDQLWDLSGNNIPLYVVLNKADLRPIDALDEVLDQVADELLMNGIPYLGLCAYSSENGGELSFRERSIWSVLEDWDAPRDALSGVVKKIEEVFSAYETALVSIIKDKKSSSALLKSLELNLLEVGAFDTANQDSFELSKYMESESSYSDKSKKESVFFGGGLGASEFEEKRKLLKESKNKKTDRNNDSRLLESKSEYRNEKINEIRDQIQFLRKDFFVSELEKELNSLYLVRSNILDVLNRGSGRQVSTSNGLDELKEVRTDLVSVIADFNISRDSSLL